MSVNKAILIGFLGSDPQSGYTGSGTEFSRFSVATSEKYTDKKTGEKKELTEWHNVSCFDRLAEIANKYLQKGSHVYIEGKLKTNKYQDKDGIDRYSTGIIANTIQMLGSKNKAEESSSRDGGNNFASDRSSQKMVQFDNYIDDDIPF